MGGAHLHGEQRPISLEYQTYPPTIDTLVTGMACAAFMGHMEGDLIDHDPDAAQDEKGEKLRRTREVYRILFGQGHCGVTQKM